MRSFAHRKIEGRLQGGTKQGAVWGGGGVLISQQMLTLVRRLHGIGMMRFAGTRLWQERRLQEGVEQDPGG